MLRPASQNEWERDVTLDVRDIASRTMLWTRRFDQEPPRWYVDADNGRMILSWPMATTAARQEIKSHARLRAAEDDKHRGADTYLQVLDLTDGRALGHVLINTGKDDRRVVNVILHRAMRSSSPTARTRLRHTRSRPGSVVAPHVRSVCRADPGPAKLLCVQNNTGILGFASISRVWSARTA